MNNKNALIFGVTGQDGSYLSEFLLSKGYDVYGVVRRSSNCNQCRLATSLRYPEFHILEGDLTDAPSVSRAIKSASPTEIYNLGAQSHVWTSFQEPGYTWDVTAKGCLNILEAIKDIAPAARFYQASSSEMFGDRCSSNEVLNTRECIDEKGNLILKVNKEYFQDEATPFNPQSPYAIAKLAAHQFVSLYRRSYGLHASSGICFNHESERRGDTFVTRKITKYVAELINSQNALPKLRLGNLDAQRDWGYAPDFCVAMWLMLQQPTADDYVIATGETHTVKEFLTEAFDHVHMRWTDHVVIDEALKRPSEVPYLCGRASKARQTLGWAPTVGFKKLVHKMVDHDVKNYGK